MKKHEFLLISVGVIIAVSILAPVAGAMADDTTPQSNGTYLARDNPVLISMLKSHIVYVGESQQARMNGVIAYIDSISGGSGTITLRWIEEDYLAAASSIALMNTSDEIDGSRQEMARQSQLFSDESKNQILIYNGSSDDMDTVINSTLTVVNDNVYRLNDSVRLTQNTARLTVFLRNAEDREALLNKMSKEGANITDPQMISDQIDAERTNVEQTLTGSGNLTLADVNSRVWYLNQQFRNSVLESLANLKIQNDAAVLLAVKS